MLQLLSARTASRARFRNSALGSPRASSPLVGGGLRDGAKLQPVESCLFIEPLNAGQAAIHYSGHSLNSERSLGHIRRQDDLSPLTRREHRVLLLGGEVAIQLHHGQILFFRNSFQPCPGLITAYHPPGGPGVRVDTHVYAGYTVPPYYDSLLAKLIVHGRDRAEALARLGQALDSFILEGVTTTIPFLARVVRHPDFVAGKIDTKFLEREPQLLRPESVEG